MTFPIGMSCHARPVRTGLSVMTHGNRHALMCMGYGLGLRKGTAGHAGEYDSYPLLPRDYPVCGRTVTLPPP